MLELSKNWLAEELVEIVVVNFSALADGHWTVRKSDQKLTKSILPHDICMLDQWAFRHAFHILLVAGIRCYPVFLSEDAIYYLGVCIGKIQDTCGLIAGEAKLGYEDENLESQRICHVNLLFARFPYLRNCNIVVHDEICRFYHY